VESEELSQLLSVIGIFMDAKFDVLTELLIEFLEILSVL
jgi:hypothetical protein